MNLSTQQERALALIQSGANVFLTGMAGTGKSTVTGAILSHTVLPKVDLCATTGIAALNLQQQFLDRTGLHVRTYTIYRYAGIALGPADGQAFEDYFRYLNQSMTRSRQAAFVRVMTASTVIIDEVSMLPGRIMDYLDFHFRRLRGSDRPFGGCQVVCVGDFLQLPPVSKTGVYDWAFMCRAWQEGDFVPCYLTEIFRQEEPEFVAALNDFRVGRIKGDTAAILSRKVARFPHRDIPRLFTHNAQVDKWNTYQLGCIEEAEEVALPAVTDGATEQCDYLIKNLVTPSDLRLKVGARVMFTANLTQDGELVAANGDTGHVVEIAAASARVLVRKDNGHLVTAEPFTWNFDPQDQNSAKFVQFPLRLAYAMTIHKSQGLTLESALIDIRAAREPGQAYVALSRLRSLGGLFLRDWFSGVFVSQEAINFYRKLEERNALTAA